MAKSTKIEHLGDQSPGDFFSFYFLKIKYRFKKLSMHVFLSRKTSRERWHFYMIFRNDIRFLKNKKCEKSMELVSNSRFSTNLHEKSGHFSHF
jgi:hypothetical protein